MTRRGEPISEYPLRHSIKTGIGYGGDPRVRLGLVPEFEEREAAALSGYTWREWLQAGGLERAGAVAYLRMKNLVSVHAHDATERERERRNKPKGRRRGY